ncbi:MAG: hypothetical protein WED34_07945 [Planctomycetales bacterium]
MLNERSLRFGAVLCGLWMGAAAIGGGHAPAADMDRYRVQRETTFEFAEQPSVARDGDRVEIAFTTASLCDVTVAIEDAAGKIVRHLASGVLGKNAPEPFQKDSRAQKLVWDGKDDTGKYLDDKDRLVVRVSLGLQPRFEKPLFWSPKKRVGGDSLRMRASAEGVYVFDGGTNPQLRLFDHAGDYVRTVYPFSADKIGEVDGVKWLPFPPDDETFPVKWGLPQTTFLTQSDLKWGGNWPTAGGGANASAMDTRDGRILLFDQRINQLATDGGTGGRPLAGPACTFPVQLGTVHNFQGGTYHIPPISAAIDPQGKWIYLAGYLWWNPWQQGSLNGVARLPLDAGPDAKPEIFLGNMDKDRAGKRPGEFDCAASVACDRQGRVYVSDYMNDRVQVFTPDGAFVRQIDVERPAIVRLHPETDEIFVGSWSMQCTYSDRFAWRKPGVLTHFAPLDDPRLLARYDLDVPGSNGGWDYTQAEIDTWTTPPTVWLARGPDRRDGWWDRSNVRMFVSQDGKLVLKRDFAAEAKQALLRPRPPKHERQRLYVNPKNGRVYIGEHLQPSPEASKSFDDLLEIDPETGAVDLVDLPFDTEDMCFDIHGHAYLRTHNLIVRYDPSTTPWREVPFDYGEERSPVGYNSSTGRRAHVLSGIPVRGEKGTMFHLGGIGVSPAGHVVVSACNPSPNEPRKKKEGQNVQDSSGGRPYVPRIFPGRARGFEIHVFDRHGQVLYDDAVPGILFSNGLDVDANGSLYVFAGACAYIDGKPYPNDATCTLIKTAPKAIKVLATRSEIPLEGDTRPDRAPDLFKGNLGQAWVEGAEWAFGGVGMDGKSLSSATRDCSCVANSRPAVDYFGRTFAPEADRYRVVALDTAGNVILRFGHYGNADSAGAESAAPVGGDEVALMHALYVATHTDHRVFVADMGNQRLVSVKLGYAKTARVPLANAAAPAPR